MKKKEDELGLTNSRVTIVQDGTVWVDGAMVFGQMPKAKWEKILKPDRQNRVPIGLNCVFVETEHNGQDINILIGTGLGSRGFDTQGMKEEYRANTGKLARRVKMGLSKTARDVDFVILQHLTIWHVRGATKLDRTGATVPAFPKAVHIVQTDALEMAKNPPPRLQGLFNYEKDIFPLEEKGLINVINGDQDIILPGISVRVTQGSLSDHQLVFLQLGGKKLIIGGDLMPTYFNLATECVSSFHASVQRAEQEKDFLLKSFANTPWIFVFINGHQKHGGKNGVFAGRVVEQNGKYKIHEAEIPLVVEN